MILFIDDRPIRIYKESKKHAIPMGDEFEVVIDARLQPIRLSDFKGHTCILNLTLDQIEKLIHSLHQKSGAKFDSLYILVKDIKPFKQRIFAMYQLLEAAGGVVLNVEDKVLWMLRLGKWDLPKGKLEKGEKFKKAAVREVEEECNVKALLDKKLCTTYHTYTHKNQRILKKTKWYLMNALGDPKLVPQKEENIEKVDWLGTAAMNKAMTNTYSSIRYVIHRYQLLCSSSKL
ncbi:NUDIX hydrolase [Aquirufa sp. Wall-65K1]